MLTHYNFVIILAITIALAEHSYENERSLLEYLFDTSRYDKSIRPVKKNSTPTKVTLSQIITAILDVDVIAGRLCSFSFISLSWTDELLTWNTSDYGGVTEVTLPLGKYWIPEVATHSAAECKASEVEQNARTVNATLTSDGLVLFTEEREIGAMCTINMKYYPLDKHLCMHWFYSRRYEPHELTIYVKQDHLVDKTAYKENQEWSLQETRVFVENYTDRVSSTTLVLNAIIVSRRPSFIIINNFIPAGLLSFLNLFTPLVPPDSERLSFAITTYLAMIFIYLSFVEDIPRNSIEICLLSYILLAFNIISTLGIIWNIFIVCLSRQAAADIPVPMILQKIMRKKSNKIQIRKEKLEEAMAFDNSSSDQKHMPESTADSFTDLYISSSDQKHMPQSTAGSITDLHNSSSDQKHMSESTADSMKNFDPSEIGWYEVTRCFDKIYFVISFLVMAIIFGIFFSKMSTDNRFL